MSPVTSLFNSTFRAAAALLLPLASALSPVVSHAMTGIQHAPSVSPACSWNRPGVSPFMGDVVGAVDRYADIPVDVRTRLKQRMAKREYDDLVSIRRDRIVGDRGEQYNPTIRDMHFGAGQVCHTVSRDAWSPSMQERGLVYCDSGHCILVPTVCRNVSRIARRGVAPEHVEAPDEPFTLLPPAGAPPAVAGAPVFADAVPTPLAIDGTPSFATPAPGGAGSPRAFTTAAAGVPAVPGVASPAGLPGEGLPVPAAPPTSEVTPTDALPPMAAAVPEPATWASLIVGLAGLALAARRRRLSRQGAWAAPTGVALERPGQAPSRAFRYRPV